MTNERSSSLSVHPGQPAVVLHIDDDVNDIVLLRAAARRSSVPLQLEHAADGEQAIAYLSSIQKSRGANRKRFPALILVDLKLPRATGLEIVGWVRANPLMRHIPVVVLSGSELRSDIQNAYDAGANSYIVKPLGFEHLVRLVQQISGLWCRPQAAS